MSGLQARTEDTINGVDVRESGSALRVATNTPHLVSLGTGRLSTAVTLHPIKQGRVTIGSDPTCDIYVVGTGVASVHCRVENSHGVVTLYPVAGTTLLDTLPVDKPTRLSQGSMLTIGRSNFLRFNHPAEALLMKSVLPSAHVSMAPSQFTPNEHCATGYVTTEPSNQCYQNYKDLSQLDQELDMTLKEMSRTKPPVAPKKYPESDSNSDQEKPKMPSIMAKVSKFEYYAKQQKIGRSQFYTSTDNEISPKVFSANSLTVNTPAKDVLGGKTVPNYMNKIKPEKNVLLNENNAIDAKNCSYANVVLRNNTKIGDIVKNFDDNNKLKKVNNDQVKDNVYGKINVDKNNLESKNNLDSSRTDTNEYSKEASQYGKDTSHYGKDTSHYGKDTSQYGKETSQYSKETSQYGRQTIQYSKETSQYGKETSQCGKETSQYGRETNQYGKDTRQYGTETRHFGKETSEYIKEGSRNAQNVLESSRSDYGKVNGKMGLPSPAYDRNPQYSPVYANQYERSVEAENMRTRAYQERIKEEEKKEAEMERLEEILDIFTEYQKQLTSDFRAGIPITPTEKRSHNKIITNGSLPRSVAFNNPNFVKTSDGYYKFDTSPSNSLSKSLPARNVSSYENFDVSPELTPEVTIPDNNYQNVGRMDEIGIPVFENTSVNQSDTKIPILPSPSPYENVYLNRNVYSSLKPKSPNTNSPRTRIKTTFAHKNVAPQYFVFPTPPPKDNSQKPNFGKDLESSRTEDKSTNKEESKKEKFEGIEKQLSLEEEIPMIDDTEVTNDIEFRYSKVVEKEDSPKEIKKNQSFDDVKKELMADIPELEAFENDLKQNKREKIIKNITEEIKKIDIEEFTDSSVLDINIDDLKAKYEKLKEERRKLVAEIHEIKCKMTEIRSQEDDILRELEMEKALIKGEYDSEIAILNIEQKKKADLVEKAKSIEDEIKQLKERQEARQNEMRDRVEVATTKVERLEKDVKSNAATLEELQNAQDILDNETKIYEDLEFQHLEEESELLSNREDIQNDIILLTKKIDAQKNRILTLKSEANNNLTSALDETKVLHSEYVKLLNQVEELTSKVQATEKELKPIVAKLNEIERAQSPDSAFYTDQTRTKSGEFGYSPQSSDSDEIDIRNFVEHEKEIKDKFNSIDQMSQSMTVDIERKLNDRTGESPPKPKKGFWERNFDSLKRKKKPKSPDKEPKIDIMSQSFNENLFYNSENIESDLSFDRFNSLRNSKKKKDQGPVKSSSSSKIPTFAALGKIMKKDSFGKKREDDESKTRYIKNPKPVTIENKYVKAKSHSPDKQNQIVEETTEEIKTDNNIETHKLLHRKSCGDEPSLKDFSRMSDKIPSQDDIDRISKVTTDAPLLSSDTDMHSLGKRTFDSLMEVERKRMEMLEEQGCQVIENEREKISELKRRVQDETKKLWDQRREKSMDSDLYNSLTEDQRRSGDFDRSGSEKNEFERPERYVSFERTDNRSFEPTHNRSVSFERADNRSCEPNHNRSVSFERSDNKSCEPTHNRSVSFERADNRSCEPTHNRSFSFERTDNRSCEPTHNRSVSFERTEHRSCEPTHNRSVSFERTDNRSCEPTHNRSVNFERTDNERSFQFDQSDRFDRSDKLIEKQESVRSEYDRSVIRRLEGPLDQSFIEKPDRSDNFDQSDKFDRSENFDRSDRFDRNVIEDSSIMDDSFLMGNSAMYDESSGLISSSIEELQVRNSRTESTEDDKRSDDSRPLSHASDFSRDNILSLSNAPRRSRRAVAPYSESQRPLTRYLPVDRDDFDLRRHVESAGHQIELCPYVTLSSTSCRGYLHKMGAKFHTWSKRWFVFDRESKTFVYYWDKSEKKPRGGAYFQVIEEVYLDHGNTSRSPSPATTFIVKTRQRRYCLMAASGAAARIWIDVLFTGAQGYTEYLE